MITTEIETLNHVTNLVRPDLSEETFDKWFAVHEWIKTCDMPIAVNSAFHMVDDMISERQGYGGGGFQYCFWFNSEEDRATFQQKVLDLYAQ